MKSILLSARDVCKSFAGSGDTTPVLDRISLELYTGDFTIIMGSSGAGKSTLLYALSGMDRITGGQVFYKEREISRLDENKMAALRSKEFGFVFQQTHMVSNLTLFENVMIAGYLDKSRSAADTRARAEQLLERMHVGAAAHRLPHQVSGGEAQRVAVARAMVNEPGLLFADEPTGALNKRSTEDVLDLLTGLNQAGQSILMVTHDLRAAIRGTRLLYLEDGKLVGELSMPQFVKAEAQAREAQVNAWLTSQGW